jgi:acetyl-CoA synthetase (ADP-forming)
VVAKIVSPEIIHKSDAHGVKVDLKNDDEVRAAYSEIVLAAREYNKDARIFGVLISEMLPKGTELIVGATRDPEFGPVVMFGLGGIFVEVLEDAVFRVAPVSRADGREMVEQIKGARVLRGIRGEEPRDIDAIVGAIVKVSQLISDHPEIQEIDLNPLFAYRDGVAAVDARILLGK